MVLRRGVSLVVGNVLMVLLVIVGVATIWSVIKPTIDKSAEEINTDCLSVRVEPVSCVVDYSATASNPFPPLAFPYVNLTVKRNTGVGDLRAVNFIFEGNEWSLAQPGGAGTNFVYQIVGQPNDPILMQTPSFDEFETFSYNGLNFDLTGPSGDLSPLVDIAEYSALPVFSIGLGPKKFNVGAVLGAEGKVCPILSQPISCTCITHSISPPFVVSDLCATINS